MQGSQGSDQVARQALEMALFRELVGEYNSNTGLKSIPLGRAEIASSTAGRALAFLVHTLSSDHANDKRFKRAIKNVKVQMHLLNSGQGNKKRKASELEAYLDEVVSAAYEMRLVQALTDGPSPEKQARAIQSTQKLYHSTFKWRQKARMQKKAAILGLGGIVKDYLPPWLFELGYRKDQKK